MNNISEKDLKYLKFYKPNDIYWGLGLENESYFIIKDPIEKTGSHIKKNRKRERYSVDYNNNYDQEKLTKYLDKIFLDSDIYQIPEYLNSHAIHKTDINGEHQTLYTPEKLPNSKFNGKTLHDLMKEANDMFESDFENNYVFDGDTIEFITQNFYKITVNQCIEELVSYKKMFLQNINKFMESCGLPIVDFPRVNYGLVQFTTNTSNIATFNNGTYHINVTIPTKLDDNANIADPTLFEKQHKNAIRLLKWLEPLMISIYGSPDVFSFEDDGKYSAGSLRLTASRYISIGTYDTVLMKKGKLLQDSKTNMHVYLYKKSWYNQIYKMTDYIQGDQIGYDINYSKHYNAGIEFRILDYFPEEALMDIMNFIILLLDHSLENEIKISCYECQEWHNFTATVLHDGYLAKLPYQMIVSYHKLLGFPMIIKPNIKDYFAVLTDYLYEKYHNSYCSTNMSPNMIKPKFHNINQYMWENNFLQYVPVNNKHNIRVTKLYDIYKRIKSSEKTFILNENNRLNNLLVNTDLLNYDNMDLDEFYAKLLEISKRKINLSKYILLNNS
ncbi:hypothetical protein QJ856_gp0183 [Tupanvirus deep ocean]|uniref:Uncharacterized protein n=2 Tax=Tupanvirus TaxID=2094720 RepID=A0AC62AA69_9VIRU|nr:hypothetical protein QJ856_gp0183 [Tupanvirus deep ocean]QKU34545.1 hypothetical protein [Tupanvirus deep ocean]